MADDAWKYVAMIAMSALGTVSGALAWVVKEWRKDTRESADKTLSRADSDRDAREQSAEKDRVAQTAMAQAVGDMADATRDHTRQVTQGMALVVEANNRLTDAVGRMRDDLIPRPRSNASNAAFQRIELEDPGPPPPPTRETGRRR